MPSLSLLHACRISRSLRPQSASCSILALRSPYACFYLILAILNYFNLSSVFILNYHAFYSLLYFNFSCLILTDAAPTCLECPRGRVAVYRERKKICSFFYLFLDKNKICRWNFFKISMNT